MNKNFTQILLGRRKTSPKGSAHSLTDVLMFATSYLLFAKQNLCLNQGKQNPTFLLIQKHYHFPVLAFLSFNFAHYTFLPLQNVPIGQANRRRNSLIIRPELDSIEPFHNAFSLEALFYIPSFLNSV
jgi:hypothetical protein